jgi:hypothetical protein
MLEQTRYQRRIAGSPDERQLMLIAVGIAARREAMREQAGSLAERIDWGRFAQTLRARRLLASLGSHVLELTGEAASDAFATDVAQAIESGRRQGTFLQLVAMRAISTLAEAGIRSTPLKGPILGEAIYGDVGRRWSSDVDLLVPVDRLRDAVAALATMGYRPPSDHVDAHGLPLLHFSLAHEDERLPQLELHWRVHWYERQFAQERLLAPPDTASDGWRPAPVDELAALLLFYARDGFIDLRLATDLSAWWDTLGGRASPGFLSAVVDRYPALGRALAASASAAERIAGLPAAMLGLPRLGWRERAAVRLANPHPHSSHPQLYADVSLIDGLLAPAGGMPAFARRQLLPPREVLRQRAQLTRSRRGNTRAGNGARMLVRYGLAMTRLAAAPERLRYS